MKDGTILCHLINKIAPGSVKKIQERGTNFQLMENIQRYFSCRKCHDGPLTLLAHCHRLCFRYQTAVKKYGVPQEEIFQTADLFERRNISQVTLSILALGRIVRFFS